MFKALSLFLLFSISLLGQSIGDFKFLPIAKPALTLKIKQTSGTNASSVTYNPKKKLYYTVFAGNEAFPFEIFDAKGKNVKQTECGWDIRGFWYNPKLDQLQGNSFNSQGINFYELDNKGFPKGAAQFISDWIDQPDVNSVGAYNTFTDIIMFYSLEGSITMFEATTCDYYDELFIFDTELDYNATNSTNIAFTGVHGMEIGILDYVEKVVYFYDLSGDRAALIKLPEDAVTTPTFCFAFANKMIFLFDSWTRQWTGYKIFK